MKKILLGFLIIALAFSPSLAQLNVKKTTNNFNIGNKKAKVKKQGDKIREFDFKAARLNKNKTMAKSGNKMELPKTHPAYNDCRNLNKYADKMELYFKGDTPESYFNKSFISKSKSYLQACKDKTKGENYDWASYETRISFIENKYNIFSGKSATASTKINRTHTNSKASNSNSNAVDNRARKSELKAELKVLKPDLETLFNERALRTKAIISLIGNGFAYEKAAKKINLAEAKQKFDEYKTLSNGVAFGISKIKSIEFLIENYDDFARDLIVAKVRKLLDESYDDNAFAASELKSLNLSKEALAYLNGASKFSSISEISTLKKEAKARLVELGKRFDRGFSCKQCWKIAFFQKTHSL